MKLLDFINKKTNNAYESFKLVSVIFDRNARACTFKFLYKDTCKDDDRETLARLIKEYLNEEVEIIVKLKKAYVDVDLVKTVINNYVSRHSGSLGDGVLKDDIAVDISNSIVATISCNSFAYGYLSSPDAKADILAYIQGFFFEPVYIELKKKDMLEMDTNDDDLILPEAFMLEEESEQKEIRHNNVKLDEEIKFKGINGNPLMIESVDTSMESVEIAGELLFLNERTFESKRKDKEGNAQTKTYFSFTLKDATARMNVVYFPTKETLELAKEILVEHKTVIVSGQAEEFNGRVNFKAKHIGLCEILPEVVEGNTVAIEVKKEPNANYIFVKPEPYIELSQDNFLAEKVEIGKYLYEHDVVVFDIETTGLDALTCEIIEIGAVKISNGKITETFETLIKPKAHIPDEIVNLTGITDDMVKDCHSIKQILPDFYKFCYDTTIMAYNIDFDYKFINIAGMKLGYNFDMPQIDAMYLARAFIPGLKNFKLGTVCKRLGVSLENAHRAVHDATATAEVVIKLSPNIT